MKTSIPDELKATVPHTQWGRILTATPVVMTIVATLLAGLASSEMTRAQYDRSLAAQQQSKAGDQWSYFQAKRLRGGMQRASSQIITAPASRITRIPSTAIQRFLSTTRAIKVAATPISSTDRIRPNAMIHGAWRATPPTASTLSSESATLAMTMENKARPKLTRLSGAPSAYA